MYATHAARQIFIRAFFFVTRYRVSVNMKAGVRGAVLRVSVYFSPLDVLPATLPASHSQYVYYYQGT